MRAGQLRKQCLIKRTTDAADTYGDNGPISTTTLGPFWAHLEPLQGKSAEIARQLRADVTHRITLRAGGGLRIYPTDQLVIESRNFEPSEILDIDERGREFRIIATEVPTQG